MDAHKASYLIAVMAQVEGARAQAMTHGKPSVPQGVSVRWCGGVWMRRWPGNTRCRAAPMGLLASAMLSCVRVCGRLLRRCAAWASQASTRARARPGAADADLWSMRITAPASGTTVACTACGSRMSPTCAAPKAGSTCAPCAMRTPVESWDTPWASNTARALAITALDMAATTRNQVDTGVAVEEICEVMATVPD